MKREIHQLAEQVEGLRRDLVPRRTQFWRLIVVAAVLLAVVFGAVGWQRVTLKQAQTRQAEYLRVLVRDCSASARLSGEQLAFCRRAIPNYDKGRAAAAQRAAEFDSLRRWARSRGWKPPKG